MLHDREEDMAKHHSRSLLFVAGMLGASLLLFSSGCKPDGTSPKPTSSNEEAHDHDHDHGHDHDSMGPHDGHIVEIGDEQLHAEWTHNDATGAVVVYLLDSAAKSDVAIAEKTISITTKIGENSKTYELVAVSTDDGQASRFTLTDHALVEALKAVGPGVEATIAVTLNGDNLVGRFERHDHSGHSH